MDSQPVIASGRKGIIQTCRGVPAIPRKSRCRGEHWSYSIPSRPQTRINIERKKISSVIIAWRISQVSRKLGDLFTRRGREFSFYRRCRRNDVVGSARGRTRVEDQLGSAEARQHEGQGKGEGGGGRSRFHTSFMGLWDKNLHGQIGNDCVTTV